MNKLQTFAAQNREKLAQTFFKPASAASCLILLKSHSHTNRKWTDAEMPWRQESNFWWATGCDEADYILALDPRTLKTCIFIPNYEADFALWHGNPLTCTEVKKEFGVSECMTMDSLEDLLVNFQEIHVVEKSEFPAGLASNASFTLVDHVLKLAIQEARVFKSEIELEFMRKACEISSEAHVSLMKAAKQYPGKSERFYSSLFAYECSVRGGYIQAYGSIVGAGLRAAVLHSSPLSTPITCSPQEFVLVDAGCEYNYYASDITRTYPFSGTFTSEWKEIYEVVLEANKAVINTMKVGTDWEDMHRLAESVILDGLIKLGILKGDREELVANHMAALFFPHGLGHLLGLDVHDTPQVAYPKGKKDGITLNPSFYNSYITMKRCGTDS